MKELQALKTAIVNPPPLDFSKIQFPPQPTPAAPAPVPTSTIRKEVRDSQDALQRRNNVIIRGLPCPQNANPTSEVRSFLRDSKIEHFDSFQNDLISAHILNRVGGSCTIRAIFNNSWSVNHILNSAHLLKRGIDQYKRVYLHEDRTAEEMREHKKLLSELKANIARDRDTRWAIRDGKVVENGKFIVENS